MTQGDWAWHMSDNGQWLGGNSSANSGCFNVAIWENNYTDTLERNVLIGKADWDRSEDDNEDGKIDDEDGADAGQYFWNGIVSCISPNGEWIVGYHTFNGTGYNDVEISTPVGFRYNTKTEVLEDTLFAGCPTVVFDDGEMMFTNTNILSSSNDKKVQCGTSVIAVDGLGQLNIPMLLFPEETAIENVKDLNVNLFVNNSTLYVEGEYTSIEVYSVLGALVGTYNTNEINVANMNKGVYVVRIINGNQATTKKINL
jgi:hypothetical protein